MSTLKDRITYGLSSPSTTVGKALPAYEGVSSTDRGNVFGAVTMIPTTRIGIYYNKVTYEDYDPIITADGAPVPALSPGSWGNLYRAGNRRVM